MRYQTIILSILLLAIQTHAWGQLTTRNFIDTDFNSSHRTWDEGPIEWSEFKGRPKTDTTAIEFHWVFQNEVEKVRHGRTTYSYLRFKPYLDMTESWSRPELQNATSLRVCQAAFDLLELYGRSATREYACNTTYNSNELIRYYNKQYQRRLDDMYYDTRKGQDPTKADLYASAIWMELDAEHFDPAEVPLGDPRSYWGLSIGYSMMGVLSDYFSSSPFGFGFSLDMGYRRQLWTLDMALSFGGHSKQELRARNGYFVEGDDVNVGMMMVNWGYRTSADPRRLCYPYIGAGVIFFDGVRAQGYHDNGQKIVAEKAGFALGAGFIYDLPIQRTISLSDTYNNLSGSWSRQIISQHSLRLKPSFNLCHLSDIGWTPCLNLCISYSRSSINLR